MIRYFLVGIGGFLGAVSRYGLSGLVHQVLKRPGFPFGTLSVNVLGSLLIGVAMGLVETTEWITPSLRLLLLIGFLGGFTTFSTFSYETLALFRHGEISFGLLNLAVHLVGGLIAVWLGLLAGRAIS